MAAFSLTARQAQRLRDLVHHYKPRMTTSWRKRCEDELWLRVLSQVVVAGNAAPEYTLRTSAAVKEKLGFRRLKKLSPQRRRRAIHGVLRAIGTRYVGKSTKNAKVDAALHNFHALCDAGGPKRFFQGIAALPSVDKRIEYLSGNLAFYKKKGCRDTLIDLQLARDCMALDRRLTRILTCLGARVPRSLNKHYEEIEKALIDKVAHRCGLSGGELDRILFQNYGDIMVRLLCS